MDAVADGGLRRLSNVADKKGAARILRRLRESKAAADAAGLSLQSADDLAEQITGVEALRRCVQGLYQWTLK